MSRVPIVSFSKPADGSNSANPSVNNSSSSSSVDEAIEMSAADLDSSGKAISPASAGRFDPLYPGVAQTLGLLTPGSNLGGATLVWGDVSVYVKLKGGKLKRLVNNVSGAAKPGSLVALMGSSGAGKSTLMTALAHRSPIGTVMDGEVLMNGQYIGDFMHQESGFMHQEDLFVECLTVMEHLSIMSRLRMDRYTSHLSRKRRVNLLLRQLGLYETRHNRIGQASGPDKLLSGGERKRLAFATELLTDPSLLFCDEPTTGLDSFSAQKLVKIMKSMAAQGKTIVCTIHQPSSELFDMFDKLILLAEGRIAFSGTSRGALAFFESLGYHCPLTYNPADFFIKVLALTPGSESASRQAIKSVCDQFAVSDAAKEVDLDIHLEFHLMNTQNENVPSSRRDNFKEPFFITKLIWLVYRYALVVIREPSVQLFKILQKLTLFMTYEYSGGIRETSHDASFVRCAANILWLLKEAPGVGGSLRSDLPIFAIALTAGLCYVGSIQLTQAGVQAVQGALFIIIAENTFSPMYSILHMFPDEFPLLHRELRAGLYPTVLYYFARMFALFPGLVVEPALFTLVVYWVAGLRATAYAFWMTVLMATLVLNVAIACGSFFSCAFGSMPVAIAYLVPFDYSLMITSGLFVKLSTIPDYISWIRYLSWLMYSNEAMTIVQWDGVQNISCQTTDPLLPCLRTGEQVLQKYDFHQSNLWNDVIALCVLYLVFHTLAFLCLRHRALRK